LGHPSSPTNADANSATAEINQGYVLSAQNRLFPQAVLLEPGPAPWLGPKPGCAARASRRVFIVKYPSYSCLFSVYWRLRRLLHLLRLGLTT